jgi:two-component system chemotaxis response regulator CheY
MKIMIVDDEPISRRILKNFLIECGYEVLSASDGIEALEIIRSPDAPRLVISDWMMPNMNGVELCEKVRGMENKQYIYFILLTTRAEKGDIIKGLESGADDFIVKPFDREELKCRVKIGERIINLERAYWGRHLSGKREDTVPEKVQLEHWILNSTFNEGEGNQEDHT